MSQLINVQVSPSQPHPPTPRPLTATPPHTLEPLAHTYVCTHPTYTIPSTSPESSTHPSCPGTVEVHALLLSCLHLRTHLYGPYFHVHVPNIIYIPMYVCIHALVGVYTYIHALVGVFLWVTRLQFVVSVYLPTVWVHRVHVAMHTIITGI